MPCNQTAGLGDLRAAYRGGRLLPFVGAGVTMGVTWEDGTGVFKRGPSWREFVDTAARLLGFGDPDLLRVRGEDLQILEYYRARNDGRLTPLTNWLVRELNAPDDVLAGNITYEAFAQLESCPTFYTTNFDNFLERGLTLNGLEAMAVATESEMSDLYARRTIQPGLCEVVKFHGDLDHPDDMVVSDSDYRSRLALETAMDDRLKADLLGRVVLFIGYSFRDWNVSYLFHVIQSLHGPLPSSMSGRRAFITVADPSDFETKLFDKRNIGVIPVSATTTTEDVAAIIHRIVEQ